MLGQGVWLAVSDVYMAIDCLFKLREFYCTKEMLAALGFGQRRLARRRRIIVGEVTVDGEGLFGGAVRVSI